MRSLQRWLVPIAGAAAMFIAGAGIGRIVADDTAALNTARADAAVERARADRLEAERDRLRIQRDRLEARLAAERAPAICPQRYVSTASLVSAYTVEYPCGWHVVHQPDLDPSGEDRAGLVGSITLFSRLPVSLAPRAGMLADMELAIWSDDPSDDEDALPSLAEWVEDERTRFGEPDVERFEAGSGRTVYRIRGTLDTETEQLDAVVAVWASDAGGVRHIARAFAVSPNRTVLEALDRLARSFRPQAR